MTESQIKASGTISGVSEAEWGGKTSPAAHKRSKQPLSADVATIRAAVLDVIDAGYQCKHANQPNRITECNLWHPWQFELHVPERDKENQQRQAFADAVVERITQLQQPPFAERKEQV